MMHVLDWCAISIGSVGIDIKCMGITYTANIIKYKLLGKNEYQPAISDDQKEESTGNQNVRYYNKKKILNLIDTE